MTRLEISARAGLAVQVERGAHAFAPNTVPAGAFVELQARLDLICVVSSCPFDPRLAGWTINAETGSTELVVEVG